MLGARGTVQVYTGDGKGKTTAALGLALRAWGHGARVLVIQFMKGRINYGELEAARRLEGFDVEQYGRESFVDRDEPAAEDVALAAEALARARQVAGANEYDLVILDEVNVAADYGLIKTEDILDLIAKKPPEMELVLTGRRPPAGFVEAADLVSEVQETKHHYRIGIPARKGIEY
ncbi:MAG: cob(I)yrinic acid a,c-diamide adenosyltransferase [candidate division Zixibacteria bacterium]|nr:cob(I)yrinic acid a,c-diamide adenosyltransferase [candidate division Zixibacteria bacterium]